jgi:hypothetical protein
MVRDGRLQPDASQLAAAQALHLLQAVLEARATAVAAGPAAAAMAAAAPVGTAAPQQQRCDVGTTPVTSQAAPASGTHAPSSRGRGGGPRDSASSPGAVAAPAAAAAAATAALAVQGAYLWGPIGSGKTLLMDLFARTLQPGVRVRREHLHGLLAHVHERCHALQEALPKVVVKSRLGLPVYRWVCQAGAPVAV